MRNQLTNPGEPIRDVVYLLMDKNWLQFGIQLLYQRYSAITKLLIVGKQKAGFKNRLFAFPQLTVW